MKRTVISNERQYRLIYYFVKWGGYLSSGSIAMSILDPIIRDPIPDEFWYLKILSGAVYWIPLYILFDRIGDSLKKYYSKKITLESD